MAYQRSVYSTDPTPSVWYNAAEGNSISGDQSFDYKASISRQTSTLPKVVEELSPAISAQFIGGGSSLNRQVDSAVLSWRIGKLPGDVGTSSLGISGRNVDLELRELLKQRGDHPLEGLHKAAAHGDRTAIIQMLKQIGPGDHVDILDDNGCTPLMYAAIADSWQAAEMLLNFSARREMTDTEGRTAVHYAAFFGKYNTLKFLISSASAWAPRDSYGRTPLHWSCANGSTKCLQVLLNHAKVVYGDINPKDNEGMTPLHCAALFGRPKHISLLNEAECSLVAVDIEGKTALHWTANNSDPSCVLALMEAYPPLLNRRDVYGCTVLHLMAANGSLPLMDTLLRIEGIEVNAQDSTQRTPLHYACLGGHAEVASMILQWGGLDRMVDIEGATPLHCAVMSGSASTVRSLLSLLPEPTHIPDQSGNTPLTLAAQYDSAEVLNALLSSDELRKHINQIDSNGRTALYFACYAGAADCVTSLISNGADPNICDAFQQTPLFPACESGHGACIHALAKGGCDLNTRDGDGHAPLHKATLNGQLDSVRALVISGADLNLYDSGGNTALHMAAFGGMEAILAVLVENRVDPNLQDPSGMAALHLSSIEGHEGCVRQLLSHNAHPNIMDTTDQRCTPLDYAQLHDHTPCADLLVEAGGLVSASIKEMAAITIQANFRGHMARKLRKKLLTQSRAVTVISAAFRGYCQRKHYKQKKRELEAAIKIQAFYRGHLQRIKFRSKLAEFKEQRCNDERVLNFAKWLLGVGAEDLTALAESERAPPPQPSFMSGHELRGAGIQSESACTAQDVRVEQKLRLEAAMKMKLLYDNRQERWSEFRDMEAQRRSDKAARRELDRLAGVLADSRARKDHVTRKFTQTVTVQRSHHAAATIQRAFRAMKTRGVWRERQRERTEGLKVKREGHAAQVIQRAWRGYRAYREYRALNYKSVATCPVIDTSSRPQACHGSAWVHSYERATSVTGTPKRPLHNTQEGRFLVFRPASKQQAGRGMDVMARSGSSMKLLERAISHDHFKSRVRDFKKLFPVQKASETTRGSRSSERRIAVEQDPSQRGPSQRGPSQRGHSQQGLSQRGPLQRGPSQQSHSQRGPSQQGPSLRGPSLRGPSQQGPSQQGPSQQGPSQQGPSQQGPSQQSRSQQGLPQLLKALPTGIRKSYTAPVQLPLIVNHTQS